uniref:Uncharacterized protein n=1 Tax=Rhizophora mucronata TaxID=61149 RepID=A0A2P2PUX4_RHIMU
MQGIWNYNLLHSFV